MACFCTAFGLVAPKFLILRRKILSSGRRVYFHFPRQVLTGHVFSVIAALATRFQAATGARSAAVTCASNATAVGRPSVNFSMSKAAAFTARLSPTTSPAGGLENEGNKVRSADGVAAGQAAASTVELGANRGAGIVRKGEAPRRDSGTGKTSRVIPMVASTTVPPGGDGELESFGEEDSTGGCTYSLRQG